MRRIILRLALITILPAIAFSASAQDATPLSLQQAMDYAVKNNINAKNARLDAKIQLVQNNQTLSAAYPHISGKAELDDNLNPTQAFIDAGTFGGPKGTIQHFSFTLPYAGSAGISGSQILFDGGVMVALQARNTVLELARQNGQLTEENVRYTVQKAYYALVIVHRQFNILKGSLAIARDLAHDISVLRQSGFAEKIDVDRTDVQLNNLATDSLKISNLLTVSEQLLKYQMGMDINHPIVLTDTSVENNLQESAALSARDVDYNQRTEYNLLQTTLKLHGYNLKRYKLSGIPTLAAFGNVGYNYSTKKIGDLFTPANYLFNSIVGVQLNVPIFSGFMQKNLLREVRLNIEKTQNSIDNIKLTVDFQAAQAKTTLKNDILQLESQKRNLELANTVLDLARKKYKAGVGSNVEVNQAQTDLLQAQNNYFGSLLDVVNAQADLKQALGLLK